MEMKKEKLNFKSLIVKSFVTSIEKKDVLTLMGGKDNDSGDICKTHRPPVCNTEKPCTNSPYCPPPDTIRVTCP